MLLHLYRAATTVGRPLMVLALRRRAGRGKEDPTRLGERFGAASRPRPRGPLLWLHAASVGESVAALPLIESLLEQHAGTTMVITTGTVTSARLLAQRLPGGACHQFAPIDHPRAWRQFFDHWRPQLGLLVESELWPNLILEAERAGTPLALINGRMSARSHRRWSRLPTVATRLLDGFELCLAQSPGDRDRLQSLGAPRVMVTGNLKAAAPPLPADPAALATLSAAIGARPVWLAASTHPSEEAIVLDVQRQLRTTASDLLTIIAPRHPDRGPPLAARLRAQGAAVARRGANEAITVDTTCYVADTLGELGIFYRLATVAFIGKSLVTHGGQNPLEAASLGCPIVVGPHTENFTDMVAALATAGGIQQVPNPEALVAAVRGLLADPAARASQADRARHVAVVGRDTLAATLEQLRPLLVRTVGRTDARA